MEGRRKDGSLITLDLAVSHTRSRKRDVFTGTFSEVQRPITSGSSSASAVASPSANAGLTAGFALLENLLFSAIVADHKGQIMFANTHAARLFGYEKSQLVGKNVRVLMPNPDSANHDTYLKVRTSSLSRHTCHSLGVELRGDARGEGDWPRSRRRGHDEGRLPHSLEPHYQ